MLIKQKQFMFDSKMITKITATGLIIFMLSMQALAFPIWENNDSIALLSPIGDISNNDVFLIWKPDKNYILYFVYIGENESNLKLVGITIRPFFKIKLDDGKTYFWRVAGFDGRFITMSKIKTFKVKEKNDWTVMIYLNGDNDLYEYALSEINKIKNISSTANIVVLFDGNKENDTFLYCIKNSSKMVFKLNEMNMGEKSTLRYLIKYSMQLYPARHYMLEIWGHGAGWMGVCFDKTDMDMLSLDEIKSAIEKKIDIVIFTACYMGCIEVAYSLKNAANYMIACEGALPIGSLSHDFLRGINDSNAENVGRKIIENFNCSASISTSLALWNLSKINELVGEINNFAMHYNISWELRNASAYSMQYVDLFEYAELYNATSLINAINETIVAFSGKKVGIGIYFPLPQYVSKYYQNLDFCKISIWDELIRSN